MHFKQKLLQREISDRLWLYTLVSILIMVSATFALAQSDFDRQKHSQVMAMYEEYVGNFPEVKEISSTEALQLISKKNVIFVDVRKTKEQKVSMIPGAVTKEQFMHNIDEYRDKKIIAYCTIGYRSGKFAEKFEKKGFDISNLSAGLLGWVYAHGPLSSKHGPTHTMNVYGKTWDLAPSWITTVY